MYSYIAQAAQARIRTLVEQMVVASKHRTGVLHQTLVDREQRLFEEAVLENPALNDVEPKIVVNLLDDPKIKLSELEKKERDLERKLRAQKGFGGIAGEEEAIAPPVEEAAQGKKGKKREKKKDISDAVKTQLTNSAALKATGVQLKSWMMQPGAIAEDPTLIVPKKKKAADVLPAAVRQPISNPEPDAEILLTSSNGERIMRPMTQRDMRRVSLIDALFSLEKERSDHRNLMAKWSCNLK